MSEIDLGEENWAYSAAGEVVVIAEGRGAHAVSVLLRDSQMDALCKWWLEQREQQAKEAHKAGRSRPISEIISDLRKEQP